MIKTVQFLLIFLFFALTACTLPATNPDATTHGSKPVVLSLARKIVPGKTSATEVKQLLGSPDSVRRLNEDNRDVWVYLRKNDPTTPRIYAFILRDSDLVKSVTWNVFEEDPESNLEYAKNTLGKPDFIRSEPEWTKGDAAPDEVYFINEEVGITIVLRKTLNHVSSIMWN